jgi:hypothetical protein
MTFIAHCAPVYAIESVVDSIPSLGLTTSSAQNWVRFVSASEFPMSSIAGSGWDDWERRGTTCDYAHKLVGRYGARKGRTYHDTGGATDNQNDDFREFGEIAHSLYDESG